MSKYDFRSKFGFHRVIEPVGVVPQAAWRVNNTPVQLHCSERVVDVKMLNLDSTSTQQLIGSGNGDIANQVMRIVEQRGKMHNPVTNSGGVLFAEYREEEIVPWASLSAIPLHLESITSIRGQQLDVIGKAILFDCFPCTKLPPGMDRELFLTALDIASLPVQVRRIVEKEKVKKMLVIGCGNAGIATMATINKHSPSTEIFGIDVCDRNFQKIQDFGFTDNLAAINAVNSEAVISFVNDCDLVVNCVNVQNTEASSVLAARERGIVIFFSMATGFDKASLAPDATGKDVDMRVASGIAKGEDMEMLRLLHDYPDLLTVTH